MRWRPFLLCHLIAGFLFFSWLLPYTAPYWADLDLYFFRLLNDSLPNRPFAQIFWALSNVKITDLYGAFFSLGLFLMWVFDDGHEVAKRRLAQFFYFLIWGELGILALKYLIFPYLMSINFLRESPSLIYHDTFMLSQVVPWLKIKDTSQWCFPGGHAFNSFQWAAFLAFFAGYRLGIIAFVSSFFFILPRLFAGAHWLSDSLAGSLPLALVLVSWAVCTPMYPFFLKYLEKLSSTIITLCRRTRHERLTS